MKKAAAPSTNYFSGVVLRIFYAFDLLYLNDRDLRQFPLIERKEKLRNVIDRRKLPDVICGKYVEGRGVDLFNEVARRNLEGVVARSVGSWRPQKAAK